MRILITGGFGFIGGRLGQYLSQRGHTVVLGSRRDVGVPEWLPGAENAQIRWGDESALLNLCKGVDVVIHAAGMNAVECASNPVAALDFNGVATARLVEAASKAGVSRFVYLSSIHIYSSPLAGRITEDDCSRNLHPYAFSHLAGELAVQWASERQLLDAFVVRLSNVYGAPAHINANCWGLFVNDMARQIAETGKMVLKSHGMSQRDFIDIEAVCRLLEWLTHSNQRDKGYSAIFNMGSGQSRSLLDMTSVISQRCKALFGISPLVERPPYSADDITERLDYSIDKLMASGAPVLNKEAEVVDELLQYCWSNFRQQPT